MRKFHVTVDARAFVNITLEIEAVDEYEAEAAVSKLEQQIEEAIEALMDPHEEAIRGYASENKFPVVFADLSLDDGGLEVMDVEQVA